MATPVNTLDPRPPKHSIMLAHIAKTKSENARLKNLNEAVDKAFDFIREAVNNGNFGLIKNDKQFCFGYFDKEAFKKALEAYGYQVNFGRREHKNIGISWH